MIEQITVESFKKALDEWRIRRSCDWFEIPIALRGLAYVITKLNEIIIVVNQVDGLREKINELIKSVNSKTTKIQELVDVINKQEKKIEELKCIRN